MSRLWEKGERSNGLKKSRDLQGPEGGGSPRKPLATKEVDFRHRIRERVPNLVGGEGREPKDCMRGRDHHVMRKEEGKHELGNIL